MGKFHREQKGKKNKRKKKGGKKKKKEEGLISCHYRLKHALQRGLAGVGPPHHISLPTERCQEADTGQINVLLVSLPQKQHAVSSEGQRDERDACWREQELHLA